MAITIEEARSGRYGRPVSVVIAELDGLDKLAELFGAEVADRLIPPVADALRRSARAADRVARLSHTRFGVLLVETDEIRAINYVERVRAACDRWLEASAIALRLSIGWASPATDGDLRSAVRIAEERMHREQRRPAPWRPAAAAVLGPGAQPTAPRRPPSAPLAHAPTERRPNPYGPSRLSSTSWSIGGADATVPSLRPTMKSAVFCQAERSIAPAPWAHGVVARPGRDRRLEDRQHHRLVGGREVRRLGDRRVDRRRSGRR